MKRNQAYLRGLLLLCISLPAAAFAFANDNNSAYVGLPTEGNVAKKTRARAMQNDKNDKDKDKNKGGDDKKYKEGPQTFSPAPTTKTPTAAPVTSPPTAKPTSSAPTFSPTHSPSHSPTISPTKAPTTDAPTKTPSATPSTAPTSSPSYSPSQQPSWQPSDAPSTLPSFSPSSQPSSKPSWQPSAQPSVSMAPTMTPEFTIELSISAKSTSEDSPAQQMLTAADVMRGTNDGKKLLDAVVTTVTNVLKQDVRSTILAESNSVGNSSIPVPASPLMRSFTVEYSPQHSDFAVEDGGEWIQFYLPFKVLEIEAVNSNTNTSRNSRELQLYRQDDEEHMKVEEEAGMADNIRGAMNVFWLGIKDMSVRKRTSHVASSDDVPSRLSRKVSYGRSLGAIEEEHAVQQGQRKEKENDKNKNKNNNKNRNRNRDEDDDEEEEEEDDEADEDDEEDEDNEDDEEDDNEDEEDKSDEDEKGEEMDEVEVGLPSSAPSIDSISSPTVAPTVFSRSNLTETVNATIIPSNKADNNATAPVQGDLPPIDKIDDSTFETPLQHEKEELLTADDISLISHRIIQHRIRDGSLLGALQQSDSRIQAIAVVGFERINPASSGQKHSRNGVIHAVVIAGAVLVLLGAVSLVYYRRVSKRRNASGKGGFSDLYDEPCRMKYDKEKGENYAELVHDAQPCFVGKEITTSPLAVALEGMGQRGTPATTASYSPDSSNQAPGPTDVSQLTESQTSSWYTTVVRRSTASEEDDGEEHPHAQMKIQPGGDGGDGVVDMELQSNFEDEVQSVKGTGEWWRTPSK